MSRIKLTSRGARGADARVMFQGSCSLSRRLRTPHTSCEGKFTENGFSYRLQAKVQGRLRSYASGTKKTRRLRVNWRSKGSSLDDDDEFYQKPKINFGDFHEGKSRRRQWLRNAMLLRSRNIFPSAWLVKTSRQLQQRRHTTTMIV